MSHNQNRVACIGAGNLTKGMLYPLFRSEGYDVTIVCLTKASFQSLQEGYSYVEVGPTVRKKEFSDVRVRMLDDMTESELADCRFITTAVGGANIGRVADRLGRRRKRPDQHIFMCENDLESYRILKPMAGNVHASVVDRIVFYENPLKVVGEEYFSFGVLAEDNLRLPGFMNRSDNFERDYTKKRYLVNTLHTVIAWCGYAQGYETINEALASGRVGRLAQAAAGELVSILRHKYPQAPSGEFKRFAQTCLERFANRHLHDPILRVGRNTLDKLKPNERLLEPILYARKYGLPHAGLLESTAYGLLFNAEREASSSRGSGRESIFSYIEATSESV